MVTAMTDLLNASGVSDDDIKTEEFGSTRWIKILRKTIKERATISQIHLYDTRHDGGLVNSSLVPTRVPSVPFIFLMLNLLPESFMSTRAH